MLLILSRAGDHHDRQVDMIMTSLPVPSERTEQIRKETATDETMTELKKMISRGRTVQRSVHSWTYTTELSAVDDVIRGNTFVIPSSMRENMLRKIREGRLGVWTKNEPRHWPQHGLM